MTKKTDDKPADEQPNGPATPPANAEPTTPPDAPADAPVTDEAAAPEPPKQPEPIGEDEASKVVYRFVGPGSVANVPPRDLTVLDLERLVPEQIRDVVLARAGGKPVYEAV